MRRAAAALTILPLGGCEGVQSVLDPAGRDAQVLSDLFWVMLIGAVILWVALNGLIFFVTRIAPQPLSRKGAEALIIGGGIVFPTVVLAGLLIYALSEMPKQRAEGEGLTLRVTGHQYWWRVEYWPDGAEAPVVSANEVRLPTGQRSEIKLNAERVIHSFWIPTLGGKTDMIPGRETRMSLEPEKPGVYRGQCTEFCGESHAYMAFGAVVMTPEAFDDWLAREARDAMTPETETERRGREVFLAEGCGGCHRVRGTAASGNVGPDLTHLAGRTTLAAGILPMSHAALRDWIADPAAFKPGVEMPAYDHLAERDLDALATYLMSLE
ncbi:cytochrome c oxidase subunit II [Roseovarius sp. SCSIO 43702]|uniref:cytochrome c oxidase subunit II n=1 Tax=Roseovarius sp. SCSIO 43702 TaxID=2823043 RepID=UPI002175A2D0|nr:cytochrome c oxidase subunit II [Roseovarius sp. SCSIO 43702]